MYKCKLVVSSLLLAGLFISSSVFAATVDTIDATSPTTNASPNYFTPSDMTTYDSPYFRRAGQDWGWAHNAVNLPFTTATLSVSAFDVDNPSNIAGFTNETDKIEGWETSSASWELIGVLAGASDVYSFTTFDLGANWADEIFSGLQIRIFIDETNQGWAVTLAKSVLATDGAPIGNPNPGSVPVPAAAWLFGSAILGFFGMRRKNQA